MAVAHNVLAFDSSVTKYGKAVLFGFLTKPNILGSPMTVVSDPSRYHLALDQIGCPGAIDGKNPMTGEVSDRDKPFTHLLEYVVELIIANLFSVADQSRYDIFVHLHQLLQRSRGHHDIAVN